MLFHARTFTVCKPWPTLAPVQSAPVMSMQPKGFVGDLRTAVERIALTGRFLGRWVAGIRRPTLR